jgi:putative sterol carrier protein
MLNFLSLDYWKKVQEIANTDEEFSIKARGFTASFTFKVTDIEKLPVVFVRFDDAKVTLLRELEEGEKTDFSLEGLYDVWMKVNKGELDGGNAIMTRQLHFRGNMSSIIRYSKAFLRLFEVMQQVSVEY